MNRSVQHSLFYKGHDRFFWPINDVEKLWAYTQNSSLMHGLMHYFGSVKTWYVEIKENPEQHY